MGKRSRSPKRRRDRSRSRERHRHSSNLKGLEESKKRLREGLESASKYSADNAPGCAPRPFDDLSHAEQVARVKRIENIEEGGFQPAQFKSTAGGGRNQKKNQSKDEKLDSAQDKHDKAMFGPAWMNKEVKKENPEVPALSIDYKNTGPPLLNKAFLIDQEERNTKWREIWKEQRTKCRNNYQ